MGILQDKWRRVTGEGSVWGYVSTLLREMPWRVTWALVLMICLSLMEGIGLLMLVPLLQLVGLDVQQGITGRIAQFISPLFRASGIRPTLVTVLAVYVLITTLRAWLYRRQNTTNLALHHEFVALLRKRLYRAIAHANWLFFARSRSSDFAHVLTNEVDRMGEATYHLLYLFGTTIIAIVYVFFAMKLSLVMTAVVFTCGGALVLLLKRKTRVARAAGEGTSRAMNRLYGTIAEHVGGIKTAKSYGAEDRHVHIFSRLVERVHRSYVEAVNNQAEVKYWFDIGSVLVLSFMVYLSMEVLAISTAELLLLLFLFARIMPRFSSFLQGYQSIVNLLPSFRSVMEMQAECEANAEPRGQKTEDVDMRQDLQLERVTFGYEGLHVVRDIDLTFRAGKTTALVGPSGAGKSTVADIVMGLIVPSEGRVLVNGTPLVPEKLRDWREKIGYVAQDTFLFHDTVRANLLWAFPDASEAEVWASLRLSAAEEFVSRLPKGLDTVVGDRGVRLSGGEKQRLALARALLRNPSLLILDEATSNLDSENEQRILTAIERLHGSMTILIISHRLSTVRGADIIYVLEEGRLVEFETWDGLMAKENGRFRAFCQAQGVEI